MKINKDVIEPMKPCKDRFDNFIYHYEHREFEVHEFLDLDNITYNDKVWVMSRLMNKNQLVQWSIMCAESVKYIFEEKYPDNKSLDNLFDYLKTITDFTILTEEQREEILRLRRDAAYAAADADAAYAAAAAADAAYAYAAADAAYAAADAAADAAYAYAAADAAYAREEQRNLNLLFLATTLG